MVQLNANDLLFAVSRLPKRLKKIMENPVWSNRIYIGGGYIRCIIAQEKINGIDLFIKSKEDADVLAMLIADNSKPVWRTENALTIKSDIPVQIITRWLFDSPQAVSDSFDFTVCCSVIAHVDGKWVGYCDPTFYADLAAKRLVYRSPVRNEDAGGSMLRVLKYYQRGYRIPLNCLGAVIARLISKIDFDVLPAGGYERSIAKVLTGLLVEVDPNTVMHQAYLPNILNTSNDETI